MATKQEQIDRLETECLTRQHIGVVQHLLNRVAWALIKRGESHDATKLEEPEMSGFCESLPKLKDLEYGSEEYQQAAEKIQSALKHHYSQSRHHPEYFTQAETWKPVKSFEDRYEVSDHGRVRSLDAIADRPGPTGPLRIHSQLRTPHVTPAGYLRLQLQKNGKSKNKFVHVLVAEAFLPKVEGKNFVNHLDSNKQNNHVDNLEWCTPSENLQHAYDLGHKKPNLSYTVYCPKLDILTLGTEAMEKALKEAGYSKARASGIWRCINQEGAKHLDLEFIGTRVMEVQEPPESGIESMNLLDVLEMFLDWVAATEKHDDNIRKTLDINIKRFGISKQLGKIFYNTVVALEEREK